MGIQQPPQHGWQPSQPCPNCQPKINRTKLVLPPGRLASYTWVTSQAHHLGLQLLQIRTSVMKLPKLNILWASNCEMLLVPPARSSGWHSATAEGTEHGSPSRVPSALLLLLPSLHCMDRPCTQRPAPSLLPPTLSKSLGVLRYFLGLQIYAGSVPQCFQFAGVLV